MYEEITGSADYSQEGHSTLSDEICSEANRSSYSNARSVLLRQFVDTNTVNAWRLCVTKRTNLICDIEAKSDDVYNISVELPDTPYNVDLVAIELSLGEGITAGAGNLIGAEKLVEGSKLFQTVKVDPNSTGRIFFSGSLDGGDRPTWSCAFDAPSMGNSPEAPPVEYAKINRILGDQGFASFSDRKLEGNSPNPPHCPISSVESLSISAARVNTSLNKLSVAFECRRPQFRFNCGGPLAVVNNDHFDGLVTADVSVKDQVLSVSNVTSSARTNETNCTSAVMNAVRQLDGRVID
ncbi:MAG: hypothetical protein AAGA21_18185 [Pseudomonadota bacterium]